jgi:hypothetical protein
MRDESGTLVHVDDRASVVERTREDSLLSSGKTDRIVEVVADLSEGSGADELGAAEGVGSTGVFPTVANKARGNKAGSTFRMSVLECQNAKVRVEWRLPTSRQKLGNLTSDRDSG